MLPGRATENAVLVLERYDVDVTDVEILRRPSVGRQAVVAKGEANFGGVLAELKNCNSHASASARGLTDPVQRLGALGQPDQHLAELARLAWRQVDHDGQLISSRDQTAVDPHCDTTDC